MKKLFTSLLLLGAVTATQAQVTVTAYDAENKSVTINFTDDGSRPTPAKVEAAIKTAFEGPNATFGNLPKHERDKMKTVILTGDWENVDINPDDGNGGNLSISKIVTEFSNNENPVTLDLSSCQKFQSIYQGVRDTRKALDEYGNVYGDEIDIAANESSEGYIKEWLETYFTSLPVPQAGSSTTETVSVPVEVNTVSSLVQVDPNYSYTVNNTPVNFDFENADKNQTYPYTMDGQNCNFVYKNGQWYLVFSEYYEVPVVLTSNPTYTFFDGTENRTQNHTNGLRQDGDNWYYDYNTYTYTDENEDVITTTNPNTPGLQEDNGGYTYNYTVTIVVAPVMTFAIHKDLKLDGIVFPVSDNFTFIPNNLFKDNENIKKAVLSNKIVAIGNKAFGSATHFEEVNFPASIQEIGYGAFKKTKITEAKLAACTNLSRIRFETFQECANLSVATFPTKIREIQKEAYEKCPLVEVDLSQCHDLQMIAGMSFDAENAEYSLKTVTLCSHPKIIRGTSVRNGGDSNGAFHLCKGIKKVEVVGCANTCVTECVCENRAFEWDITHNQTGAPADIYEKVAELIYPKDLPACANSGYTSSYDFFVGDYKAGTLMMQETLLGYHRQIPNYGEGQGKFYWYEEDQNGKIVLKEEVRDISADDRYIGNGWLEFVLTGATQYVPKGEFLRTYSRTAGDGPLKLPKEVTAYRAVDYKTDQFAYVLDRQGKYFYDATVVSENEDDKYKLIDGIDGSEPDDVISAAELAHIGNSKRYSHLTIGGKLFLRPLVAKVAEYPGITGGYTGDNIALFDSEEVYSQLTAVPGGISYVPEGTGVVLYSEVVAKDAVFMLGGDFGTGTVYKKFPHTGNRYEEARGANEANDINMLQGSYGTGWPVAPVFPWVYSDEDACKGGHYSKTEPKAYRNFACVMTHEGETLEGGLAVRNSYGWKRLQPSKLKVNRAFAQIPVSRFDNFNEDADLEQFPGFTIEDTTADVPEVDNEGTETSGNANLMLISIFEGQSEDGAVVDGIEEVKTVDNVVAKKENNAWYTLQGVRVSNLTKGIYIHNGKKVVIK